jgi:hypothetical protein
MCIVVWPNKEHKFSYIEILTYTIVALKNRIFHLINADIVAMNKTVPIEEFDNENEEKERVLKIDHAC